MSKLCQLLIFVTSSILLVFCVAASEAAIESDVHEAKDDVAIQPNKTLKKAHAILMVLGPLWCFSFAILNVRQTRGMWPTKKVFGWEMWYFLHRMDTFLGSLAAIIAVIIIFVDVGGWIAIPHSITGIISFTLMLMQPFIAAVRANCGEKRYALFNWLHFFIGHSALILIGVTMFLGFQSPRLGAAKGSEYIILAIYVVNFSLQGALEVYRCVIRRPMQGTQDENREILNANNPVRYTIIMVDWILMTIGVFVAVAYIAQAQKIRTE